MGKVSAAMLVQAKKREKKREKVWAEPMGCGQGEEGRRIKLVKVISCFSLIKLNLSLGYR